MKCKICGNEYPAKELNKSSACEGCSVLSNWEKIVKILQRFIFFLIDKMGILTKKTREAKFEKAAMVFLMIIFALIVIGIVLFIINIFGNTIFYILGIAAVSGVVYVLYENIVEVLVGLVLIFGGIMARVFANSGILPWYLSILTWGLIVGLIITPFLAIVDIKNLKKDLNKEP